MNQNERAGAGAADPLQNLTSDERSDSTPKIAQSTSPGFVGYDQDGRLVHYCHCGKWGSFGHHVSLHNGNLGVWRCREHRS